MIKAFLLILPLLMLLIPILTVTPVEPPRATAQRWAALPLRFESGVAGGSHYVARGAGYRLQLSAREATLGLRTGRGDLEVRMKLLGANPAAQAQAEGELPGRSHYYLGTDPTRWRTNITSHERVRYRNVYPGVDLVYYGSQGRLEYDFLVAPGADSRQIRLAFDGADNLRVDGQGDVVLATAAGEVRQHRPRVYQRAGGQRREVTGQYVVAATREVGFTVGEYDSTLPLVIDPVLSYSSYLGGGDDDRGNGIGVDSAGNIYVAGYTASTNFPTASPRQSTSGGRDDVFVLKLNPAGTTLLYATYLGGSGRDRAEDLAVDASGNVYVTGQTDSTNFPTTTGAFQTTGDTAGNAFVVKLNPTGSLVYSTYLGGSRSSATGVFMTMGGPRFGYWSLGFGGTEIASGIAVDGAGNAYVTGLTLSSDFPTVNALQGTNAGGNNVPMDAFVTKVNPTGSGLVYSTYLGGRAQDAGFDIAVDPSGNAYVVGATASSDFRTTAGAFKTSLPAGSCRGFPFPDECTDAFVVKLNPSGNGLVYSTFLGGRTSDTAYAVAVDSAGNAHVTGYTSSPDFPTVSPAQAARNGTASDGFVTKLNPGGSALVYSTYLGGSVYEEGSAIVVDASGNAHVAGDTASSDFPTTSEALQRAFGGGTCESSIPCRDAFLVSLSPAGALLHSSYLGGRADDVGAGLALDGAGNLYVAGFAASANFPTANPMRSSNAGQQDVFVAKITGLGPAAPAPVTTVSAASFTGDTLAPESIVSAFGQGLADATEAATATPLPTTLGGATVKVTDSRGTERLAPLFFASAGQINYLIPEGTQPGRATVTVTRGDRTAATGSLQIDPVAPALFTANASGRGVAAAQMVRADADGTQTAQLAFRCGDAPGSCTGAPIDLGPESTVTVLVLFGTGIRGRSAPSGVTARIGGENAEVLAAGPQGQFVGLDQVNVRIPRSLNGRGEVNVVLAVDGKNSNTVTINIGRAQTNTPPRISNLAAACCLTDSSGRLFIAPVRFDFVDPDADIVYTGREAGSARLRLTVPPTGSYRGCTLTLTGSELNQSGRTSGTITYRVTTPGGQLTTATLPLQVTLFDAAGNESNTLNGETLGWNCP